MKRYKVMTSWAHMPRSVRSPYRNVAVVELDDSGVEPKMISERARGVRRIVKHFGAHHVGKTERCAYAQVLREAQELADRLNAGLPDEDY